MSLDWEALRQRLATMQGKPYWRSLEELADTDEFQDYVQREFPERAAEWTDPVTRRQFLTLMGASLALAGLGGCSSQPAPAEKILPYVRTPEQIVPGQPLYFATAMTLGEGATGLLVRSNMGRPTKIEGNPDHPANPSSYRFGPTDRFAQASLLGLYDPDRSQSITYVGRPRAWNDFLQSLSTTLRKQGQGAGLRVLTGAINSPALAAQLEALQKTFPEAKWHQYEPVNRDQVRAGASLAFGQVVDTIYDVRLADVILALDADFLGCGPGHLRYVREFAARRRIWMAEKPEQARMNRLYAVECMPSSTGSVADQRLPLRAGEIGNFARALAVQLKVAGMPAAPNVTEAQQRWLTAVAADLQDHRGRSLVVVGDGQPPGVHALVHAINHALGNLGKTVLTIDPVVSRPADSLASLRELVQDMEQRRVEILVVLGTNPVYTAPADFHFQEQLTKVPLRIHLGLYQDETAIQCHWHIPEKHYLESWGDARAYDGTVSIAQPLIAPLYASTRSAHEVLAAFLEQPERLDYEIVRDYWRGHWPQQAGSFDSGWEKALHDGFLRGTQAMPRSLSLREGWADAQPATAARAPFESSELEIVFQPDPTVYDGRFANNAWLQELPKPVTKLTWDNAVFISPKTAERLQIPPAVPGTNGGEHGQALVELVDLHYRDQEPIRAPVWVLPGHADDSATIHLGYGRTRAGKVGDGTGFNAYTLRTSAAPWFDTGLIVHRTGARYTLACTQMHHSMEGRDLVKTASVRALSPDSKAKEDQQLERRLTPLTLYSEFPYAGYKWGMVIDLSACLDCKACVVACQSENSIPVVGKTEVVRGREMHWLRIDRYYEGDLDNPTTYFQPVPCMHCENAPCELVCPVAATLHSSDGLNDMVYNRCVGTRYCSNNCPYKVRRFNFLQYADYATESLKLMRNPDVTVRSRGVMEKCTYCVQRIRAAEIEAKNQDRRDPRRPGVAPIYDGEVLTACQAACPADAIVFGDLNDPNAKVTKMAAQPLNYALLAELNTRPRTTYLAAVRNPNPALEPSGKA